LEKTLIVQIRSKSTIMIEKKALKINKIKVFLTQSKPHTI